MEVYGQLLTDEQREKVKAPLHTNKGKSWDLHDIAMRVQRGYALSSKDEKANAQMNENLRNLYSPSL